MGTSTDAILVYGYDLGSEESLELEWLDHQHETDSIHTQLENQLLRSKGFTEEWVEGVEGYFTRKSAAEKDLGLGIIYHCSYDYPMFILGIPDSEIVASRGYPQEIEPDSLHGYTFWKDRLSWGLKVLGIKPDQFEPAWLLASMWG